MTRLHPNCSRPFSREFRIILAMIPGEEKLLEGVPIERVHNISKSLVRYGAPVRCRSTNHGVRVRRLLQGDHSTRLRGATHEQDRGKWLAQISIAGNVKFLGRYRTELEAHQAYQRAKQELLGAVHHG